MLHQVVIRIARERERIQAQRVDDRQLEQSKIGIRSGEVRKIERDDVVAEDERCAIGELVEAIKSRFEIAALYVNDRPVSARTAAKR